MKQIGFTAPGTYATAIAANWLNADTEALILTRNSSGALRQTCTRDHRPIKYTDDPEDLRSTDAVVAARATAGIAKDVAMLPKGIPVISTMKGMCPNGLTAAEILDRGDKNSTVVLSGPSIASDMADASAVFRVALAGTNDLREHVAQLFDPERVTFYPTPDRMGTELLGIMKNVSAIAYGIVGACDGVLNGETTNITQILGDLVQVVLGDMQEILRMIGSRLDPSEHPGGLADYHVTCEKGRNKEVGRIIGSAARKSVDINKSVEESKITSEGYYSLPGLQMFCSLYGRVPPYLLRWVDAVVSRKMQIADSVFSLKTKIESMRE